ncbi:MAG: hypothetical protein GY861_21855 [bacterium]|nr:hypothetical protein [bacterium]
MRIVIDEETFGFRSIDFVVRNIHDLYIIYVLGETVYFLDTLVGGSYAFKSFPPGVVPETVVSRSLYGVIRSAIKLGGIVCSFDSVADLYEFLGSLSTYECCCALVDGNHDTVVDDSVVELKNADISNSVVVAWDLFQHCRNIEIYFPKCFCKNFSVHESCSLQSIVNLYCSDISRAVSFCETIPLVKSETFEEAVSSWDGDSNGLGVLEDMRSLLEWSLRDGYGVSAFTDPCRLLEHISSLYGESLEELILRCLGTD